MSASIAIGATVPATAAAARRVAWRSAGICGAYMASQLPSAYLVALPLPLHDAWLLGVEMLGSAAAFGIALALALEVGEQRYPGSRLLRTLLTAAAAAAAVLLTAGIGGAGTAVRLGLTSSEHALQLHGIWSNVGIAVLSVLYLGSRRDTLQAEGRCHQHELQWMLARRRMVASEARATQSRVDPQTLFDCLGRAQALYPAEPARADAVLDHLTDYLRLTLAGSRLAESTVAHEVAIAGALLCLSATPATLETRIVGTAGSRPLLPGAISELLQEWARAAPGDGLAAAYSLACDQQRGGLRIELAGPSRPPDETMARCRARLAGAHAVRASVASRRDPGGRFVITLEIDND